MRGDIAWGHCVGTLPNARQTRAKGRRRMTKGWSPGGPAKLGGATQVPREVRSPPPAANGNGGGGAHGAADVLQADFPGLNVPPPPGADFRLWNWRGPITLEGMRRPSR